MLENLAFRNVGPAREMALEFSPRLNLITGDNGLGKSFILDAAWWALTRTWARRKIVPHAPPAQATIDATYTSRSGSDSVLKGTFDRRADSWKVIAGLP